MMVLTRPTAQIRTGFTCQVCGHPVQGSAHTSVTCPTCRQTYTQEQANRPEFTR